MNHLIKQQLQESNGIVTSDYSTPLHYKNFVDLVGGETNLMKFPLLKKILENTRTEHIKNGGPHYQSLKQLKDSKGEWLDGADIDYFYLDDTNTFYGQATISLLQEQYCILTCVTISYKGQSKRISKQAFNTTHQTFSFSFENFSSLPKREEVDVFVTVNQISSKALMTTQILQTNDMVFVDNVSPVRAIKVNDPVHIETSPPNPIVILYDREHMYGDEFDYNYPEARVNNIQKLFIPFDGEVFFSKNSYSYLGYDHSSLQLIIDSKKGVAQFNGDTTDVIKKSRNSNGFTWSFPDDWNTVIPSRILPSQDPVALKFKLNFSYSENSDKQYEDSIFVASDNSTPNPNPSKSYKQIPFLLLLWGCLGKDTSVLMADKSHKKISDIKDGEEVMTSSGEKAVVVQVLTGHEERILCIKVKDGRSILATSMHPFTTKRGIIKAKNLNGSDLMLMANGEYVSPTEIYEMPYRDKVYNLKIARVTKDLHHDADCMICNDFVVGDNAMQNQADDFEKQSVKIPAALQQEINLLVGHINQLGK
jgi:hypothetical protein